MITNVNLLLKIDVEELKRSKTALNAVIHHLQSYSRDAGVDLDGLVGLQNFLDAVQDQLVLKGIPERTVFDFGEG